MRQVIITISDDSTGEEIKQHETFEGDELTSPEYYAIAWLNSQEVDHLSNGGGE